MSIKFLSVITLASLSLPIFSQIDPGTIFINSSLKANRTTINSDTPTDEVKSINSTLFLEPTGGYFIAKNLSVGPMLGFTTILRSTHIKGDTHETEDRTRRLAYDLGVRFRYYHFIHDKVALMAMPYYNYRINQQKDETKDLVDGSSTFTKSKWTGNIIGFQPGVTYFFNDKWAIETLLGYIHYTIENDIRAFSYGLDLNIFSFSFGLSYYIGKNSNSE